MKKEYSTDQIAQLLNVNRSTVCGWINNNTLNAYKLPGGANRVTRDDLEEFMRSYNIPLSYLSEGKTRVLIVDDDTQLLCLLTQFLVKTGRFIVHVASSGFDAGIETGFFCPQIIILDIGLPDIDGRYIADRINKDQRFFATRIIGISGLIDTDELAELKGDYFTEFIQKPFLPEQLISTIDRLLKSTSPQQTIYSEVEPTHSESSN